jgi:hypothetical protein
VRSARQESLSRAGRACALSAKAVHARVEALPAQRVLSACVAGGGMADDSPPRRAAPATPRVRCLRRCAAHCKTDALAAQRRRTLEAKYLSPLSPAHPAYALLALEAARGA